VEFVWNLYAVRNRAEDRPTVVESLILKRNTFSSVTLFFRPYCGPGVNSTSNKNAYQGYHFGGGGG
jgi:hypothetical protein